MDPRHPSPAVAALACLALWLIVCLVVQTPAARAVAQEDEDPFIQGRCVEYDPATRRILVLKDLKSDLRYPDYSQLPPAEFRLPEWAAPEPKAGGRVRLDIENQRIVLYDPAVKGFRSVSYILVEQHTRIDRRDPRVWDAVQGTVRLFPEVDRASRTVTIYSRRQDTLTTFTLPEEFFGLPPETWDSGDEVRLVYGRDGTIKEYENLSRQAR